MLSNYFKIAWRNLTKNKVYSFINIAGLAIGLACAILITLWIQDERSIDRFHTNGGQLYRIMANLNWGTESTIPYVPFNLDAALKKDLPEVKYVADLSEDNILLTAGNTHYKQKGFYATGDFLRMFSFPLLKGDVPAALRSPNEIVITQKLARKYFGDTDPIGKVISINNTDVFTVAAILKDIPSSSSLQFD
jgi:putative ABC transport system permease protein